MEANCVQVLEKVRGLEKKMSTQIDKLASAAAGRGGGKEQLRAKPEEMEVRRALFGVIRL